MSVHTVIAHKDLENLLRPYALGPIESYEGVNNGVTNTIYRMTANGQNYILTLFEELTSQQLPFYIELMDFLADRDYPCPHVLSDSKNNKIQQHDNKPFLVMTFLNGEEVSKPKLAHCAAVGATLGKLHTLGASFPRVQADTRGAKWREQTAKVLLAVLSADEQALLHEAMRFTQALRELDLPNGIIHADLFPDNVLFMDEKISGVLDFYYACQGAYLYDLAITLNAWCLDKHGCLDPVRSEAMLAAYQNERHLEKSEQQVVKHMLVLAALRFWLSRLYDHHFCTRGDLVQVKDPSQYRIILSQHLHGM